MLNLNRNLKDGLYRLQSKFARLKRNEQELRETKAFVESVMNNVPNLIYSVDSEMKAIHITPKKSKELYG